MLLDEDADGCHEGGLVVPFACLEHRADGDRRLSRADVALQEPLHRGGRAQIGGDLAQDTVLGTGQRPWQRFQPGPRQLPGRRVHDRRVLTGSVALHSHCQLHAQQFMYARRSQPVVASLASAGTWTAHSASSRPGMGLDPV